VKARVEEPTPSVEVKKEPSSDDFVVRKLTLKEEWLAEHVGHPDLKQKLRVTVAVENLIHRTRFGEAGRVVAVSDGSALVELEAIRCLAPVILPIELLCPSEQLVKATTLKTLLRVSIEVKKMILMEIGVTDPQCEQIEVLTPKNEKLADHQVDIFAVLVRWSLGFEHEQKVQYVPLSLSRLILEGVVQETMGNYAHPFGNDENHKKRMKIFKAMFRKCELLLLPYTRWILSTSP